MNFVMWLSNRPVLIRSAMIIGLEVAPVAPQARFAFTSSGSTESSHNFVPQATSDCNGVIKNAPKNRLHGDTTVYYRHDAEPCPRARGAFGRPREACTSRCHGHVHSLTSVI